MGLKIFRRKKLPGTWQSDAINQNREHRKKIWFENEGRYVLTALAT